MFRWTPGGSRRDYQWPVTFSGQLPCSQSSLWQFVLKTHCLLEPSILPGIFLLGILHSSSPVLSPVLATSSPWKILKHFFFASSKQWLCLTLLQSHALTTSCPLSFLDWSETPVPLSTLLMHRTQRDFTCCLVSLKLGSRPGLEEAGPQEKLTEKHSWAQNLFIPAILSKCPWTKDISSLPFSFDWFPWVSHSRDPLDT